MLQKTDDWFEARLGKVTASRVADALARTKSGYSTSRANYAADLIVERLTRRQASTFSNDAMRWGTENEPAARAAYEAATGELVEEVGFIDHPTIPNSGCSPDGVVGAGLIEIKCPYRTAVHLDTLLANRIPSEYLPQLGWQLACTGAAFVDFVSFDPRLEGDLRLFIKRADRSEFDIEGMEAEVRKFLEEVDHRLETLIALHQRKGASQQ